MNALLTLSGECFSIERVCDDTGNVAFSLPGQHMEAIHLSGEEAKLLGQALLLAGTRDPLN